MMMQNATRRALIVGTGIMLVIGAANAEQAPVFAVGQEWSIADLSNGRAVIGRIENSPMGEIVHISLQADAPAAYQSTFGPQINFGHLPMERSAFARSARTLTATQAASSPDFEGGYAQWREAQGGIFTITVAEAVQDILHIISSQSAPK